MSDIERKEKGIEVLLYPGFWPKQELKRQKSELV